ncbi:MAG: patatin-like phospholipase family protein [Isosphaeraceae bacterium]|nr:patatin-like phospholipase family protein [Isosphaeraceae bacterium]
MPVRNPDPSPDRPFEIGLVLAGAVSAGAYTAGVVDFLVQALDEWQKAKDERRPNCPPHQVRLKVLAGASAGGITAGLTAGLLQMDFESATVLPPPGGTLHPRNNNLYESWVNAIDIASLLDTEDLARDDLAPVQSLLDSSVLDRLAARAFQFDDPDARRYRPYVNDPLHVLLTVTNLRGVPYAFQFLNYKNQTQYEMTYHADYMDFVVGASPLPDDGAVWLKPYDFANRETWGALGDATLATGAFPFGLAPRPLKRKASAYAHREWRVPGECVDEGGALYCELWKTIPPVWPPAIRDDPNAVYEFLCVDGGMTNNEPLDLARRRLAGKAGTNPREGDKAIRAVIMVDPFPRVMPYDPAYQPRSSLFGLIALTFNGLIAQARFRPEELALADDPEVYSRFLIIPRSGTRPDGTPEPRTIAGSALEGFGGFLSQRFREHDYQLGRRNCQWFLQQYFALPAVGGRKNALFDHWTDEARREYRVVIRRRGQDPEPTELLPIIPLLGSARELVPRPAWPRLKRAELHARRPQIERRLNLLVDRLLTQNVSGWFASNAGRLAWTFQRGQVIDMIIRYLETDLIARDLLT